MAAQLHWTTISCFAIYIALLPFYIYGFRQWYHYRNHFLFRLRYSYPEGFFLIIIALLIIHIALTRDVLDDVYSITFEDIFSGFSLSYVNMIHGAIYYRAILIFLTYRQHQLRLCQMGINLHNNESIKASSPRKHLIPRMLVITYMISSLSILIFRIINTNITFMIRNAFMLLNYVVAIVVYIMVKKYKVRELIGCLFETYVTFTLAILTIPVVFLLSDDKREFGSYIIVHLWALSNLYLTLYFIYKAERNSRSATLDEVMITSEMSEKKEDTEAKHMPMIKFLCNQKDYEIFSKYLACCFCLENLMFIQSVCVFRWLLVGKMNHNTAKTIQTREHFYYSLKFEFAENMYKNYNEMMEKEKNGKMDEDDFESHCAGLWKVCASIYNEFISNNGMNQVNIPHDIRIELENKFQSNGDKPQYFESYEAFMNVFDSAVNDVWHLLGSVYNFRFATYLERSQVNN